MYWVRVGLKSAKIEKKQFKKAVLTNRFQKRPQPIFFQVFKAMKRLGYEWKVVSSFHIKVRRVNPITKHVNKISLQVM